MPRTLAVPGMVIAGDAAGMVNIPELKGIHYAMHAGMYAAEAIVEALKGTRSTSRPTTRGSASSLIGEDLYRSRNMRQPFSHGFFVGGAIASVMTITRGAFPGGRWHQHPDAEEAMEIDGAADATTRSPTTSTLFDKLSSVFASGNATRDDAPNHIRVQRQVPREVAQTWVSMCPAQVYEIPEEQLGNGAAAVDVHITPVELRPVRRDHRQGRAPDPARGRRRAALPGDVGSGPQSAVPAPEVSRTKPPISSARRSG